MASNTCAGGQSFGTIEIQMQSSLVLREFLRRKAHPPDSRYSVLLGRAPCEAWRPMATPTDQARSREGRVVGFGRGGLGTAIEGYLRLKLPQGAKLRRGAKTAVFIAVGSLLLDLILERPQLGIQVVHRSGPC